MVRVMGGIDNPLGWDLPAWMFDANGELMVDPKDPEDPEDPDEDDDLHVES